MKVYKGLLRQKGYQQQGKGILGSVLKFGVPVVGGLLGELVGGLIKNKIQKGSGIRDLFRSNVERLDRKIRGAAKRGLQGLYGKAMKAASGKANLQDAIQALGNTGIDFIDKKKSLSQGLRQYGTHALNLTANRMIEQKLNPFLSKPVVGPILRKTLMPLVRRKVDTAIQGAVQNVLGQRGKGVVGDFLKRGIKGVGPMMKSGIKAIFRRGVKKQVQKGAKKLAQTAAEQAISGATKAGIDVLRGKNVKQAVRQRMAQALSNTSQVAKRTVNKTRQATKQAVNRTTQAAKKAVKRKYNEMAAAAPILANAALDLRPVPVKRKKRKRAGDIFD